MPADITGVSCARGEVEASVFDRYRTPLYRQAGYKPYIIAAMILLSKVKEPVETLKQLLETGQPRFCERFHPHPFPPPSEGEGTGGGPGIRKAGGDFHDLKVPRFWKREGERGT